MKNRGAGAAESGGAGPSTVKRPAAEATAEADASDNGPKQKKRKAESKAKIEVTEDQGC